MKKENMDFVPSKPMEDGLEQLIVEPTQSITLTGSEKWINKMFKKLSKK